MKRLLLGLAFALAASGAQAQDAPPDKNAELRDAYDRATAFQVLHVQRDGEGGYVYQFEPSPSAAGTDADGQPRVLTSDGGVLMVRSSGVPKVLVFVQSDGGPLGLSPNSLLLTEDNPVGQMKVVERDARSEDPLSRYTLRVYVCVASNGKDGCARWAEAAPPKAEASLGGTQLLLLDGGEARPVED
ncbi:hypothetical protein [Rubricoccus marinus]|uniref:Uncharacterized protein n=1 Tax=Rubricoccus marinus TaxID=716817 RepID=A0A259U1D3_9BACT|nr:hypothetical protein [Rubricoccus marinus]OZC03657.1 hypothetical protein BSZ36_12110 [Rubricoccus marinus]